MKISHAALQKYFEKPLPSVADVAESFTFHAFEIDSIEGDILDVKVLPNRAADCSTEQGIARELGAILDIPLQPEYATANPGTTHIRTSLAQINSILGSNFYKSEVEEVFRRLRLAFSIEGDTYIVTPPTERVDLTIPADVAEEVGQIMGYDRVPATELPPITGTSDQTRYRGIERMKDQLVEQGFVEVSTQSFTKQGDIELANPLDKSKPFLRTSLEENLNEALERAKQSAPLVLAPNQKPKLFEVGIVFPKEGEHIELRMTERVDAWGDKASTVDNLSVAKLEDYGKDYEPKKYTLGAYKPFSVYPFITRDIALWAPSGAEGSNVEKMIRNNAGELLVRLDQFDRFEKEGRISLAFRLVFQSPERTLTDDEINGIMSKISTALTTSGYEIR